MLNGALSRFDFSKHVTGVRAMSKAEIASLLVAVIMLIGYVWVPTTNE